MSTSPARGSLDKAFRFLDTSQNTTSSSSRPRTLQESNAEPSSLPTSPLVSTGQISVSATDIVKPPSPISGTQTEPLWVVNEANPAIVLDEQCVSPLSEAYQDIQFLFVSQLPRVEEAPRVAEASLAVETPPPTAPWRPSELPARPDGEKIGKEELMAIINQERSTTPPGSPLRTSLIDEESFEEEITRQECKGKSTQSRVEAPDPVNGSSEAGETQEDGTSFTTTPTEDSTQTPSSESTPTGPATPKPKSPPAPLLLSTVFNEAANLPLMKRFMYLLRQATTLIETHGPYGLDYSNRLITAPQMALDSTELGFHHSLAMAQDALPHPQPQGVYLGHLKVLQYLWATTIHSLNQIIASNILDLEVVAWGIFGLSAGYSTPDKLVKSHRDRLHAALLHLPELSQPATGRTLEEAFRAEKLTRARRVVHICAVLLLQTMRTDWNRVRWGVLVKVCERWIQHLGEDVKLEGAVEPEEAGTAVADKVWKEQEDGLWLWKPEKPEELEQRPPVERRHSVQ